MTALLGAALLAAGSSPAVSIVVKATATAALALVALRLARRSCAAARHVLLAAAFAALLALPIAALLAPAIRVAVPIAAAPARVAAVPGDAIVGDASNDSDQAAAASARVARSPWPSWPALAGGLWALGAMRFFLPVIAGLSQIRSLRRSGLPWRDGQSIVDAAARDAGIRRAVALRLHESVPGPMTCGTVRPVIVLPVDARHWPEAHLRTAVVHELEHVRRGDWLTQVVARLVCAGYWFHPLVWIAWRHLSLEAERACDDAVLRRAEATAYADQLVGLAERLSAAAGHPALAMAGRHDLAARIAAVLDTSQARGRAGVRWLTLGCAAAALVVATISPLRLVAAPAAAPSPSPTSQKFAAVTIRPCEHEPAASRSGARGGGGGNVTASPGSLHIDCSTLQSVIDRAYVFFGEPLLNESGPPREDSPRVTGGPGWLRSEQFTIEARADSAADRAAMMGPMLRAFLEDRLQLKLHRETANRPAYALTVAKAGLKIAPIGPDGCVAYDPSKPASLDPAAATRNGAKPVCGSITRAVRDGMRTLDLGGMELEILMVVLKLDRPVVDRTGLTDRFNIHLQYVDETPADGTDPPGPNVFRALEQQLGLKLEPVTAPHGFIVIDKVAHP